MSESIPFVPVRFVVTASFECAVTGQIVPIVRHECRDRAHAQTLLTEIRELAADLAESGLLPGLSAVGYELCEPALPEMSDLADLVASLPEGRRDTAWWEKALGLAPVE